jgi:sigma-B regulation protein RsbU (phosphoserine phosphatase)
MAPGDVLVAYSDGVTEAINDSGLFGEERLVAAVREHAHETPDQILSGILARVNDFSGGSQSDDLTLVVTRVR